MTRRRSSAPGARPARRLSVAIVLVAAALVLTACGGGSPTAPPLDGAARTPTAPAGTDSDPGPPSGGLPTRGPGTASDPPASDEPAEPTPQPATPTDAPTPDPTDESTSEPTDPPDPPTAGAAECAGTDENREFYEAVASAVAWTVYCPALPAGWFVESGQYRLADGGRMEISYRGPGGAGLMLQEGHVCAADAGCVPPGEDRGTTAFGDREGTLLATDNGWAVVVEPGGRPTWVLLMGRVDEELARRIAADLVPLGG